MKRSKKNRQNDPNRPLTATKIVNKYGLTKPLIKKYFPKPDLVRDHGNTGHVTEYWYPETVQKVLLDPSLKKELENLEKQRAIETAKRNEIPNYLSFFSLDSYIERGSRIPRRFVIHVGPTNSGKTYDSIKRMTELSRGIYLGPLRLLALEMFEKLNDLGCPCDLLTGEESEAVEGSSFLSCTIEMCRFDNDYDIAVIDEAQLIADEYRGANWTKAICLVRAREVHICTAPEGEEVITGLIESMGMEYEVVQHERLAPLVFDGECRGINMIEKGDCIIAFSRKNVLGMAASLERMGLRCSVIYGALPPHARREEVRKFTSGVTSVVVATDAIGMGVSLPIRRIIFSTVMKFDGKDLRRLSPGEIKQIAGRAGRYGIYDEGHVLSMQDSQYVGKALDVSVRPINRLYIPFPEEALDTQYDLAKLLSAWRTLPKNKLFRRENTDEAEFLLGQLKDPRASENRKLTYDLITCPVDVRSDDLVSYWVSCATAVLSARSIPLPWFECEDLEGCELQYRAYDIYHQILRKLGIKDNTMEEKAKICRKIAELMEEKGLYLKRCRICHAILPFDSQFNVCERCYRRMSYYAGEW